MTGIFINYRRDDAPGVAGRLGDRLAKNFSQREIFMDVDAMKPGLDFVKQLDEQVSKCDVFLAVIGPNWLNASDEKGRRKLDLPRDYVRVELASALKREIPVIPLLVNGAAMPAEDDLPDDLKSLPNRHALELRHTRFAADSEAIIQALNVILPRRTNWRRIAGGAGIAVACVLAGIALWYVQSGHFVVSDVSQTKAPAKQAPAAETRAEVSNVTPAPKPPSASILPIVTLPPPALPGQKTSAMPPAPSEDRGRFALVIANAKYPDADAPLSQPINDGRELADELRRDGFNVDVEENLSSSEMRQKLDALYRRIGPGSTTLIFFSGFGIQSLRQSYMIPVDASIWTEADVRAQGFGLESVLAEINNRGAGVKIALVDASRRNPFERRFRASSGGLAPVIAPNGTLVMYSASLGSVVVDGGGDHSLFVQELLKQMRVPDLMAEEAFNRTRVSVSRASRGEQMPWISSSLQSEFSFIPPQTSVAK